MLVGGRGKEYDHGAASPTATSHMQTHITTADPVRTSGGKELTEHNSDKAIPKQVIPMGEEDLKDF